MVSVSGSIFIYTTYINTNINTNTSTSIRFEVYCYSEYYAKPKRPWKAEKAGALFILYYFVSVITLLVLPVLYFMNTTTFAKDCDIQDDTVHLCDGLINDKDICIQDKNSNYYDFFQESLYPRSICQRACGPFIFNESNFEPLLLKILDNVIIKWIWKIFFDSLYIPWVIIVFLAILLGYRKNTSQTLKHSTTRKISTMEVNLMKLKTESRRQEKSIARLKIVGDKSHITND